MHDLQQLFDAALAPAYAVGDDGLVSYANPALCAWVSLKHEAVLGRLVEYHSEPRAVEKTGPLAGLCPPPMAFERVATEGTLSTMGQDGRLRHRRARFFSLSLAGEGVGRAVLAVADERDLSPLELAAALADEPTEDQLHRDIRRFRRGRNEPDATALMLGDSPAARLMRSRFDLAQKTTAGVLIASPCAADAAALARAVHYGNHDSQARLLPVDCRRLDADAAVELMEKHLGQFQQGVTLLLEVVDAATPPTQQRLSERIAAARPHRVVATVSSLAADLAPALRAAVATLQIESPPLAQRLADLPMMVQYYLERANSSSGRRVGRATPAAVDQLALYDWPHGAAQLGEAVAAAHASCQGVEVTVEDLPPVVRHAALASGLNSGLSGAGHNNGLTSGVDLDQLLRRIERELVERALDRAGQNKAEAARLLGLTRQRFYRRLESLGLLSPNEDQPQTEGASDA